MSNKRILFAIPDYDHITLRSVKLFHNHGWDVSIVAPYHYKNLPLFFKYIPIKFFRKAYNRRAKTDEILKGFARKIKIIHLPFLSFLKRFSVSKQFQTRVLRRILESELIDLVDFKNYDVCYCFDTAGYSYLRKSRESGVKSILECRGAHYQYSLEVNHQINKMYQTNIPDIENSISGSEEKEWWYHKLTHESRLADYLICYSEFQKNQFIKYSAKAANNIFIIPLPATVEKSTAIKRIGRNKVSFVFVGNMSYVKGIPLLLSAWKNLVNEYRGNLEIELNLYGKLQIEEVGALIEKTPKVHYHGPKLHREILKALKNKHDVFVFPSLFDTFGLALIEAIQLNLPVVTNYTNGAAELINDEVHCIKYKDSYDIDNLKNSMMSFLYNPGSIEEFSKNIAQLPSFTDGYINELVNSNIEKLIFRIQTD